ncbi:MAG: CDP-alcohol phosphatidyltransferase family protein [Treponema sp.]|jgi:CDP-diacylglycerol--glycerol-3-phosphate 3-phosphatidyltransferase|nr:CDP-alcohol phosphatidyltransferase family protein [Treponema sp.]
MKRYAANIITNLRIVFSILLLIFPAFSFWFYAMYLAGGITDMIDGAVARKTNSVTPFGSRLDSFADLVFVLSALAKILPTADVPKWALIWTAVIAAVKIAGNISGFVRNRKFLAEHTVMNKITGFMLFLLPLTFPFVDMRFSLFAVCFVATAAAVQEAYSLQKGIEI